MTELATILQAIDQLGLDQLEQVRRHIEARRSQLEQHKPTRQEGDQKVLALQEAIAEFREGLSEEELAEIAEAMNIEYIDPDALKDFDWIDQLPEDER